MKKIILVILIFRSLVVFAQQNRPATGYFPNATPIPPSVVPFIKYDEVPVSEYTGVPVIEIPIYTIREGNYELPVAMNYHAGGIKVADEATWVGLGWNLDLGSVVQLVNDRDDLDNSIQKILPDYFYNYYPVRWDFQLKYSLTPSPVLQPSFPPSTGPEQYHSFFTFSDYYVPVNGSYDRHPELFNASGFTNGDFVDSEPDVFKATFNNHSIQFIIDPKTGTLAVLNKKNYKVEQTTNAAGKPSWKIIAPDGVQYFFEQIDEEKNLSGCTYYVNNSTSSCNYYLSPLASRIWHITKVKTPSNRYINFSYDQTAAINSIPSYSDGIMYVSQTTQIPYSCGNTPQPFKFNSMGWYGVQGGALNTYSISALYPHTKSYLSTINFSLGSISFKKSANRQDNLGDVRLDSIIINNTNSAARKFAFNYDYFYGSTSGATFGATNKTSSELAQRLKLVSMGEVGIPPHQFIYDSTPLPQKTSFATDYWGFYNGVTTNVSFIPNPIDINRPTLPSNGNDHKAYLASAKAGTLVELIYPTGGKTDFNYELNSFLGSGYSAITAGAGLRVSSVTSSAETGVAKKVIYTYESGLSINKMSFYSHYSTNAGNIYPTSSAVNSQVTVYAFDVKQISGKNFYTSSLLGSGNFVGYGKVTKSLSDQGGNSIGKTTSYYSNTADIGAYDSASTVSLPARKNIYNPDNGLLIKEEKYDQSQNLISSVVNNYQFQMGSLYYGAKTAYSNQYAFVQFNQDAASCYTSIWLWEQDLIGFYPLYGGESLLQSSVLSTFNGSDAVVVTHNYLYDNTNLLQSDTYSSSKGETINTSFSYPLSVPYLPNVNNLIQANILDHPVSTSITNNSNTAHFKQESYGTFSGLTLVNGVYEVHGSTSSPELRVIIDNYDAQGNLLQFHKPNDVLQSVIWGYNNSLVIAEVKNASINQIAYSGFENTSDQGGWVFSASSSSPGKTGSFCYSGSSISKTGLPSGNYTISFWAKRNNSNGSIGGSISTSIINNDWQLYTFNLNNITSVSLTLDHVLMDDLRLFPVGSLMTTYTHDPGAGVTSVTDSNNLIKYYEYDNLKRLKNIYDSQKRLLNGYQYGYKSQN